MIHRNFSLGSFLNFGGSCPSTFLILRDLKYFLPPGSEYWYPDAPPHIEGVGVENGFGVPDPLGVPGVLGVPGSGDDGGGCGNLLVLVLVLKVEFDLE
jgi:hypothetical protein